MSIMTLFVVCSCQSGRIKTKSRDQSYQGLTYERYLLGEAPFWLNQSFETGHQRALTIKYLNFKTLKKSYNLTYPQLIHLQHSFNVSLQRQKKFGGQKVVLLKDEAFLFSNTLEKILGGSYEFLMPDFEKVSLLWIDPLLDDKEKIKDVFKRKSFGEGHPVMVSNVLSQQEMMELVEKLGLSSFPVRYLSVEMFSKYKDDLSGFHPYWILYVNKILEGKKVTLFSTYRPKLILGKYQFKKIE